MTSGHAVPPSLAGRRALVTGASAGIGEACSRALAAAGARVACMARRADRIEKLAADIDGLALPGDVTDDADVARVVEDAASGLGGLDLLVNNAGVMLLGGLRRGRPEAWRRMIEVNLYGLLAVTRAALPHLEAAGHADVVNVSSMSGRRVRNPEWAVYSATKFGIHALSTGMRAELSPAGIRVLIVSPGFVVTELAEETPDDDLRDRFRTMKEAIGLSPWDVARQVVQACAQPHHVTVHEIAMLPTAPEDGPPI